MVKAFSFYIMKVLTLLEDFIIGKLFQLQKRYIFPMLDVIQR